MNWTDQSEKYPYRVKLGYNELGYNELGYNELGYNELGYNEHPVIMNKLYTLGWLGSFYGYIFPVLTNKTRLYLKNLAGPEQFVITEFDCICFSNSLGKKAWVSKSMPKCVVNCCSCDQEYHLPQ